MKFMNFNRNKKTSVLLGLVAFVGVGCTQGQESFSTEPGKGFGWKDMTETQKEIHKGLGNESITPTINAAHTEVTVPSTNSHGYSVQPDALSDVTRVPEHYMKVWFAPYQDSSGNLHEECAVHTVMKSGQWIVPTVVQDLI